MNRIIGNLDRALYRPLFENKAIEPVQALEWAMRLAREMDDILPEYYVEIPHAVSAFWLHENEIFIATERSFDENDPYISEESRYSPPEMQYDRFWRRNITRLTYLVCQVLLSLLSGKLPKYPFSTVTFHHLIGRYSQNQISNLQEIFGTGLNPNPQERFQNFRSLVNVLLQVQQKFQTRSLPIIIPPIKSLENLQKLSPQYELLAWIPKYENVFKLILRPPTVVILGRKLLQNTSQISPNRLLENDYFFSETSKQSMKSIWGKFAVQHEVKQENNQDINCLWVEGDPCLSRQHLAIHFSLDKTVPWIADIGSTHGIVLFADANCEHSTSILVRNGEKVPFRCEEDQYLQVGNTFVRIRSC